MSDGVELVHHGRFEILQDPVFSMFPAQYICYKCQAQTDKLKNRIHARPHLRIVSLPLPPSHLRSIHSTTTHARKMPPPNSDISSPQPHIMHKRAQNPLTQIPRASLLLRNTIFPHQRGNSIATASEPRRLYHQNQSILCFSCTGIHE